MGFQGMDITEVNSVGRGLQSESAQLGTLMASVTAAVNRASGSWKGADARAFAATWQSTHLPVLRNIQSALDSLGATAIREAAEQSRVSNQQSSAPAPAPAPSRPATPAPAPTPTASPSKYRNVAV
jgi:uncharacterized protein YukE